MQSLSITSLITLDRVCPLANRPFRDIALQNFQKNPPTPYVLAIVVDHGTNFTVVDATALQESLEKDGFHLKRATERHMPPSFVRLSAIHYYFMNSFAQPLQLLKSRTSETDHVIQDYLNACSNENSEEVLGCRKRTISWLYNERRWKECFFWTHVVLKQVPQELKTLKLQAELMLDKTKEIHALPTEKIVCLERLIALDPKCDSAMTELGLLYLRGVRQFQPDADKARQCFDRAVKANAKNEIALSHLTDLLHIGPSKNRTNGPLPPTSPTVPYGTLQVLTDLQRLPQTCLPHLDELSDILRLDNCLLPEQPLKALKALKRILEADKKNAFAHARIGELFREGCKGVIEKDRSEALTHFQQALECDPDNPFALPRLGALYIEHSELVPCNKKMARELLQKARRLLPTCLFTLKWQVVLLLECNEPLVAKNTLEEMLELDPDNIFALTELALLFTNGCDEFAQDPACANALFRRAYKINPKNIKVLNGWGELLRTIGDGRGKDLQQAKKIFTEVFTLDHNNIFAKSRVAEILRISPSGLKAAQELFSEVLQIRPSDAFSEARLGAIYLFGGEGVKQNLAEAEKLLRKAQAHDPSDCFALAHFGEVQRRLGLDLVQAEHFLQLAYQMFPDDPDTLTFLGALYLIGGPGVKKDRGVAAALFEKANRLAPSNAVIGERIRQPSCISVEAAKSTPSRKRELLELHLKEQPNNHFVLIALGEELSLNPGIGPADLRRAEEMLKKARILAPDSLDALKTLAELYRLKIDQFRGQLNQAIDLFMLINSLEPNNAETLARLGFCLKDRKKEELNDLKNAEEYLKIAQNLAPTNPLVLAWMGDLLRIKAITIGRKINANAMDYRQKNELLKQAEALLKKALSINNSCIDAIFGLAEIALERDLTQEARVLFNQVLSIDPELEKAQVGITRCLDKVPLT